LRRKKRGKLIDGGREIACDGSGGNWYAHQSHKIKGSVRQGGGEMEGGKHCTSNRQGGTRGTY